MSALGHKRPFIGILAQWPLSGVKQTFERQLYLIDISQMIASPAANTLEAIVLRMV